MSKKNFFNHTKISLCVYCKLFPNQLVNPMTKNKNYIQ